MVNHLKEVADDSFGSFWPEHLMFLSKSPIFDPWVCHIQSLTIFHNIKTGWFRMVFKFWPFEPYLAKWSKFDQHMVQTGASTTRWFQVVPDVEELVILRWGTTCPLILGMFRGGLQATEGSANSEIIPVFCLFCTQRKIHKWIFVSCMVHVWFLPEKSKKKYAEIPQSKVVDRGGLILGDSHCTQYISPKEHLRFDNI